MFSNLKGSQNVYARSWMQPQMKMTNLLNGKKLQSIWNWYLMLRTIIIRSLRTTKLVPLLSKLILFLLVIHCSTIWKSIHGKTENPIYISFCCFLQLHSSKRPKDLWKCNKKKRTSDDKFHFCHKLFGHQWS